MGYPEAVFIDMRCARSFHWRCSWASIVDVAHGLACTGLMHTKSTALMPMEAIWLLHLGLIEVDPVWVLTMPVGISTAPSHPRIVSSLAQKMSAWMSA